jgi:hypothetical protein
MLCVSFSLFRSHFLFLFDFNFFRSWHLQLVIKPRKFSTGATNDAYNVVASTTFCRKNIQQITLNQNLLFNTIISGGVKNLWTLKGTSIVDHRETNYNIFSINNSNSNDFIFIISISKRYRFDYYHTNRSNNLV